MSDTGISLKSTFFIAFLEPGSMEEEEKKSIARVEVELKAHVGKTC